MINSVMIMLYNISHTHNTDQAKVCLQNNKIEIE